MVIVVPLGDTLGMFGDCSTTRRYLEAIGDCSTTKRYHWEILAPLGDTWSL